MDIVKSNLKLTCVVEVCTTVTCKRKSKYVTIVILDLSCQIIPKNELKI